MNEEPNCSRVEEVVGSYVEDPLTFWAQNSTKNQELLKLSCTLAEVCPQSNSVFGVPNLSKIYGGRFSEDKCWYRCKVQKTISDEKCLVTYIDYGNKEILSRSQIVELPMSLQFPNVAKRYRLWGLQIPADQNVVQLDQGRKFLGNLIFEKGIRVHHKATYQDGTISAQARFDNVDIGEEVAKKGYAERCVPSSSLSGCEEKRMDNGSFMARSIKSPIPLWGQRPNPSVFSKTKGRHSGRMTLDSRTEHPSGNHAAFPKDKLTLGDFSLGSNVSLEKIKQDQKLIEENEKLKLEKEVLLGNYKKLELEVEQAALKLQQEKEKSMKSLEHLENSLQTYVGTKMKTLASKVEILKEVRQAKVSFHFGDDLLDAVKVVTEGCLTMPSSLNDLEKIWVEYNLAQEKIQSCQSAEEGKDLIARRNEVRQKLYNAVEVFVLEVDELSLSQRLKTLKQLSGSLEAAYGEAEEVPDSSEIFQQFYDWKHGKQEEFNCIRTGTDASLQILVVWFSNIIKVFDPAAEMSLCSEELVGNVDEILEKIELNVSKELEVSLVEQEDADKEIILSTYNQVQQKIHSEEKLIKIVLSKYGSSIEFKQQTGEWLNENPNVDHLLSIKKTLKSLKAQLRWKLVEKSNLEESDEVSESEISKVKDEIIGLRDDIFQKIYREQEEYEKLNNLVQNLFPELPLLHPEAGILKYMNSSGLLTLSLERDLLDTHPMRKLSSKRPLVCSQVDGQKVLLKAYPIDVETEPKIIKRAARYHRAWKEAKEESGLLPLKFLFLCKSDPLAYLIIPYYPEASLSVIQSSAPLTSEEVLKVMRGVACGLHTLHKANIVHGALHQNNVFALNREQGVVGDFDFTKSVNQRASMNSMVVGGMNLIAPELKLGQPASPSSDMYAYGCLFLWLCAQNEKFETNEDGVPEVDELHLDDGVKSLLSSLICSRNSVTAEQVLSAECFLHLKMTVSPDSKKGSLCDEEKEPEEKPPQPCDGKAKNEKAVPISRA
ncbi:serine/threonine-protein kinase 31 [Tachyglossus aculeatus]|uniref:serine/threonine-protein kinase 31 n=1 Tax=Tachyglossus aculeatus TaxID=9261 RepID=UPI0018F34271|nr:serine/threonine-protein kinase 31 [Tachyglossus aculeatus]